MTDTELFRAAMRDVVKSQPTDRVPAYRPKPVPRIVFKKRHDSTRTGGKVYG